MKFKALTIKTLKNTDISVLSIPIETNDWGISSKKEISNIMPDEKPMPATIPLTFFLKRRASATPIKVVELIGKLIKT